MRLGYAHSSKIKSRGSRKDNDCCDFQVSAVLLDDGLLASTVIK